MDLGSSLGDRWVDVLDEDSQAPYLSDVPPSPGSTSSSPASRGMRNVSGLGRQGRERTQVSLLSLKLTHFISLPASSWRYPRYSRIRLFRLVSVFLCHCHWTHRSFSSALYCSMRRFMQQELVCQIFLAAAHALEPFAGRGGIDASRPPFMGCVLVGASAQRAASMAGTTIYPLPSGSSAVKKVCRIIAELWYSVVCAAGKSLLGEFSRETASSSAGLDVQERAILVNTAQLGVLALTSLRILFLPQHSGPGGAVELGSPLDFGSPYFTTVERVTKTVSRGLEEEFGLMVLFRIALRFKLAVWLSIAP